MKNPLIERDGYLFSVHEDALDKAYVVYGVYEPRNEDHCILKRTVDVNGNEKWWGMPMDDEKIYELIFDQFPHLKDGENVLAIGGSVYHFIKEEQKNEQI